MRKTHLAFIVFVVGLTTVGIPSQVQAAPSVPKVVDGTIRVAPIVMPGHSLTHTFALAWRTNQVAASFVGPDDLANGVGITVAAHTADGWQPAQALGVEEAGPDAAEARTSSTRVFTNAQWFGAGADALRVHVALTNAAARIGDLRLHLENTEGNAFPPTVGSTLSGALRAIGHFLSSTASTPADAAPMKPSILSRAQWGANESWRTPGPGLASTVKMVFIHHTDNTNSYSRSESAALVRGIYRYHTLTRGYSDIAYNFLVDRYGQIFEGRWGGITKPVIGAHTLGFNTATVGVALIGTFDHVSPTSSMMLALKRLLAWKMDVHHIPPVGKVTMISNGSDKFAKGTSVSFNRISGHRDADHTDCPGALGYKKLPWLRTAVNATGLPKIYLPTWSGSTLRPDGDTSNETFWVHATLSTTASWTLSILYGRQLRRTITGTGSTVNATWNGTLADGTPVATGLYSWSLIAKDANGYSSTPVSSVLYVINRYPNGVLLHDSTGNYTQDLTVHDVGALARTSVFGALPSIAVGPKQRSFTTATGTPLALRDGTLLVGPDGTHYIFSASTLRPFAVDPSATPADTFAALGYQSAAAISVDADTIDSLGPQGAPVSDRTIHPDGTVVKDATGALWELSAGMRHAMTVLARAASYRSNEVVTATDGDLALPAGVAYAVRVGALVKATDGGTPWLITGSGKQRFRDWTLFGRMGFTSSMLLGATQADLDAITTAATFG